MLWYSNLFHDCACAPNAPIREHSNDEAAHIADAKNNKPNKKKLVQKALSRFRTGRMYVVYNNYVVAKLCKKQTNNQTSKQNKNQFITVHADFTCIFYLNINNTF